MPRKSDSIAINNELLDRRVKLTKDDKLAIVAAYQKGDTSYNKLAQQYGVSKRLVSFVVNPEKYDAAKKQRTARRKDGRYYDQEKT